MSQVFFKKGKFGQEALFVLILSDEHTQCSKQKVHFLSSPIFSVQESNFNVSNPLKMIIHGFGSGCNKVWPKEMRLSFLKVVRIFR